MPLIQGSRLLPIAAAILAATICSSLSGQTVRGTVIDSATSSPISAAMIELVRANSQVVARERSDDGGAFRIRARGAGWFRVRVQRIGYRTLDSLVNASGDTMLVLRLVAAPVELGPVGVTAEQLNPKLNARGFYERRQGGVGHFIDPAQIEKLAPKARLVADLFDHIPGVSIVTPAGIRVPHLRSCRTVSRRQAPLFGTPSLRDPDTTAALSLYPRVYLDGMDTGASAERIQDTFGMLQPAQILAIEIYMGAGQIPLQYGGTDAPCGVILLWTKN